MISSRLSRGRALGLLTKYCLDESVVRHARAVSRLATEIAEQVKSAGRVVDVEFVETAALLHDIGRCRTHGIAHGVAGAEILKDYPRYARVCATHIGAGLSREEARDAGLPPQDYLPETLEEKIIAHADNLIDGDRVQTLAETVKELEEKLGPDHPSVERARKIGEEIEGLMGGQSQ